MTTYQKEEFIALGSGVKQIARVINENDVLVGFIEQDIQYINHFMREYARGLLIFTSTEGTQTIGRVKKEDVPGEESLPKEAEDDE